MTLSDDRVLWRARRGAAERRCVMISCCTGAELQLLDDEQLVVRELHPDKSALYERARDLRADAARRGFIVLDFDQSVE